MGMKFAVSTVGAGALLIVSLSAGFSTAQTSATEEQQTPAGQKQSASQQSIPLEKLPNAPSPAPSSGQQEPSLQDLGFS